jgi:hypothetical protein
MMPTVPEPVGDSYTDAEVDAAVEALTDPARLREVQDLVARAAPQIQRVLDQALASGGWFGSAHEQAVVQSAQTDDVEARVEAVRTLLAEETRIGMFVGVTVGFGLAEELSSRSTKTEDA